LTFDLILIGGLGIMMHYPCTTSGDCTFSCSGFIVGTDRQTDRITDAAKRLTHATVVGVHNKK